MWMGAGEGLQLPITPTNSNTLFKIHQTIAWSLLLAKKFPLPASAPHKTVLHIIQLWTQTLLELHSYYAPHPPVLSAALFRAHHSTELTKCQLPAPLEDPPSPVKMPIPDPPSRGTLMFYHMSGDRNNSLEGASPPLPSCKQRNSLFLE